MKSNKKRELNFLHNIDAFNEKGLIEVLKKGKYASLENKNTDGNPNTIDRNDLYYIDIKLNKDEIKFIEYKIKNFEMDFMDYTKGYTYILDGVCDDITKEEQNIVSALTKEEFKEFLENDYRGLIFGEVCFSENKVTPFEIYSRLEDEDEIITIWVKIVKEIENE